MPAKEIQRLDYVREGVRYTIHVEEANEGTMWGTWNCHDCDVGGSSAKKSCYDRRIYLLRCSSSPLTRLVSASARSFNRLGLD